MTMDTPRQRALRAWRERAEAIRAEQRARAKEAARWAQGAARSAREARYLETWQAIKDVDWVLPPREYWSATSRRLGELLSALQFVLRTGDPVAMEEAVRYLEADPW